MVQEIGDPSGANPLPEDPEYAEHSAYSKSKKVIDGPVIFEANGAVTISPIQGTVGVASASIALLPDKAYRVVASTDTYFRLSKGGSTAVAGDIYLPANTPIVIATRRDWDSLDFIQVTMAGIIQAVEVK